MEQKTIHWLAHKKIDSELLDICLSSSIECNQFTNRGPCVVMLEKVLEKVLQISPEKSVIVVANGTVALHAIVSALNIKKEKQLRFATQSYTFPASSQGSLRESIIIDIDSEFGPDLELLEAQKDNLDGVIVTNVLGHVVDLEKYEKWCKENSKILVLDNAATSSTFYKSKNSVNFGVSSVISLHHTKPIGFGEGGVIIIDRQYEPFVRRVINFGYDMVKMDQQWNCEGSNYKMSDISAAYILQHLHGFYSIKKHHQKLYKFFLRETENLSDKIDIFPNFSIDTPFVSCFPVFFKNRIIKQEDLDNLKLMGIDTKKYYKPLVLKGKALEYYDRNICFPCNIDMTLDDVKKIVKVINNM